MYPNTHCLYLILAWNSVTIKSKRGGGGRLTFILVVFRGYLLHVDKSYCLVVFLRVQFGIIFTDSYIPNFDN